MCISETTSSLKLITNSERESGVWKAEKLDRALDRLTYMEGKQREFMAQQGGSTCDKLTTVLVGTPKGNTKRQGLIRTGSASGWLGSLFRWFLFPWGIRWSSPELAASQKKKKLILTGERKINTQGFKSSLQSIIKNIWHSIKNSQVESRIQLIVMFAVLALTTVMM